MMRSVTCPINVRLSGSLDVLFRSTRSETISPDVSVSGVSLRASIDAMIE